MSNSQYEYLVNALDFAPFSISEIEIEEMLPQIDFLLFEFNIFGDSEEIDEVSEFLPTHILEEQLFPEFSKEGLAKWYWVLAIYLANEISKRNMNSNDKWVNEAINAINQSKIYFSKHELRMKQFEREMREARSNEGTNWNNKRHELLNIMKKAAFAHYESAISELQIQRQVDKKKTDKIRTTYKNAAKIIYPKIVHLNKDQNGQKIIGRNNDPVGSLAKILKKAVADGKLKSPRRR